MKIPWRTGLVVAGVIFLGWIIVQVVLAGREPTPAPPGSQPVTMHGGQVRGNRISARSWTFDYTKAQMSPDGTIATVDGVHHGVLYKKGKPYLGIAAEHVSVNTQTFDFTAIGDVHISYLQPKDRIPKSFDTDLVQWTNATKLLTLQHPSIVRTGDQTLKVASITVDFNKNEIHLGRIEGSIKAPNP